SVDAHDQGDRVHRRPARLRPAQSGRGPGREAAARRVRPGRRAVRAPRRRPCHPARQPGGPRGYEAPVRPEALTVPRRRTGGTAPAGTAADGGNVLTTPRLTLREVRPEEIGPLLKGRPAAGARWA